MEYKKDVHTEHCCVLHGCKYGDDDCPVQTAIKPQSYLCEDCVGWSENEDGHRQIWDKTNQHFEFIRRRRTNVPQTITIDNWNEETQRNYLYSAIAGELKLYLDKGVKLPDELLVYVQKYGTDFYSKFLNELEQQLHVLTDKELEFWMSVEDIKSPKFKTSINMELGIRHNEKMMFDRRVWEI